ncbi:MAG: two-component regulator propeller domain-containing protein [Acidobacteriota bacterium]
MQSHTAKPVTGLLIWTLVLFTIAANVVFAERLPVKSFTTTDGLAQNTVNRIVRDSRGFLWFCTDGGLSRYDGYTFTNYGIEQGLPDNQVRNLLETRDGKYWVATFSGLCQFNPTGRPWTVGSLSTGQQPNQQMTDQHLTTDDPMFVFINPVDQQRTASVNALLEDRAGDVWCGAGHGLYRLEQVDGQWMARPVEIGLPREVENDRIVRALVEDRQGALWIGAGSGLYRRWSDGRAERYTTQQGLPANDILALLVDTNDHLWVATRKGLSQIAMEPGTHQPKIIRVYTEKNGLPSANTRSLFQSSTGQLWVGLVTSLVEFIPQARRDDLRLPQYTSELILSKMFVQSITEDRDGNLWIGTDNGALKLARNGFTTYTEAEGLGESRISALFESRAGDLCAMTILSTKTPLSWFAGKHFRAICPRLPQHLTYFGWGWNQLTLQDQAGEWWLPTGQGLVRYPKVSHVGSLANTPPKAIYTTKDGLVSNDIFRLYEDSRGDIWIATFSEARGGITRWERTTETFHHYGEADGLPLKNADPTAFAEDREGNLWIGFIDTDFLARFRDGHFTLLTTKQGLPAGGVYDLYLDRAGRLWIASTLGGLTCLDDTSAEQPRFLTYTTAQGLSGNTINCITEDLYGRLYVGTARGLDRLDPISGRVKPFTVADGLIAGEVLVSFRDHKGDLWFGGKSGLSRLTPQPDPPQTPPPVLITGLRIGGETQQISALGETRIAAIELAPDKNQVQLDFVALGFSPGEGLRYQYKLEGASEDWSPLSDQRTVNFARLAPGSYRFLVRAVNADGVMSQPPASFSFRILPALWQRWWFLTLTALAVAAAVYALFRYRIAQLLKVERLRMRIASDLHDDIGSSLSQISIISEVVRAQLADNHPALSTPLSTIAQTSRELVDSMSDIVWAINPKRDNLQDLVQRMRRFASDTLTAQEIDFEFIAPDGLPEIKLDTDKRREIFLIFKESINNAVRHARCTEVFIELSLSQGHVHLDIKDNGKGFDVASATRGHGLFSMRQRAERINGRLQITSTTGLGTSISLQAPLKIHRHRVI